MKKLFSLFLVVVTNLAFLSSCNKDDKAQTKTFVLVHGAFQGAYAWDYLKPKLEANGQKVVVVELPAHGKDSTSPATLTMDSYRDKVVAAIKAIPGKVILVAHSMGGMVATATAEKIPERIEKLVYIGAFVPANGQSLLELSLQDSISLLGPSLVPSPDGATVSLPTDKIVPIFCQDGSNEVKTLLINNRRVEPTVPLTNKVTVTAANFGKTDKYYIHTLQDMAVGINLQKRMVTAAGITTTFTLNSSHCPFLSMPDSVSSILMDIIR